MIIQWFPGHMHKTGKILREEISKVDVIVEILDARIPGSSLNPVIEKIAENRRVLYLLNKADLADSEGIDIWLGFFRKFGKNVLAVDARDINSVKKIVAKIKEVSGIDTDTQVLGERRKRVRAMITGVPNVGKSTLINTLAGSNKAATGNRPAVTKSVQKIRTPYDIDLIDTPGILWPKFENQRVGFRLAVLGSIRDEILDIFEIVMSLCDVIRRHYQPQFLKRFGADEYPEENIDVIALVGLRRGCKVKGGDVDYQKAAGLLLRDVRDGKLGPICLEFPDDVFKDSDSFELLEKKGEEDFLDE
ncbi:MAG: ribosome biogenesis GTPase YlqF [Spirochaetales bacterium]|nr:ribosome biogenesis GTPase YlqF [Spirochaetales bacterium]